MNDPQIWTLIGVFTATMLGGMTLMTTLLSRTMSAKFEAVDAKFDSMDAKFESLRSEMNARFDTMDVKLAHLDRDVTYLMRRAWGDPAAD
ncbi:MAG: hypothetical protein QM611_10730 [Microbacterium sp.]|uniref:hypothetical protein n=1 Tax=Microbacterium sp. TaxID=51671 RepID=UPI0039E52F35